MEKCNFHHKLKANGEKRAKWQSISAFNRKSISHFQFMPVIAMQTCVTRKANGGKWRKTEQNARKTELIKISRQEFFPSTKTKTTTTTTVMIVITRQNDHKLTTR